MTIYGYTIIEETKIAKLKESLQKGETEIINLKHINKTLKLENEGLAVLLDIEQQNSRMQKG